MQVAQKLDMTICTRPSISHSKWRLFLISDFVFAKELDSSQRLALRNCTLQTLDGVFGVIISHDHFSQTKTVFFIEFGNS